MFAKWMHKHLNRKVSHYKSERFPVFLVYHLWDKASILWVGTVKRGSSWPIEHKCLKFSLGYRELRCVCWGKGKCRKHEKHWWLPISETGGRGKLSHWLYDCKGSFWYADMGRGGTQVWVVAQMPRTLTVLINI